MGRFLNWCLRTIMDPVEAFFDWFFNCPIKKTLPELEQEFVDKVFDESFIEELIKEVQENTDIELKNSMLDSLALANPMWNKICRDWYVDLCQLKKAGSRLQGLKNECGRRLMSAYLDYLRKAERT